MNAKNEPGRLASALCEGLGLVERLRTRPTGDPYLHMLVHEAADEIERLRVTLVNESRRVCGVETDCVLQPHCSHAQKCMRPEWDAKA